MERSLVGQINLRGDTRTLCVREITVVSLLSLTLLTGRKSSCYELIKGRVLSSTNV